MDASLDDYYQLKTAKNKRNKPSGILNRLGPKISPAKQRKQHNTQFKVTGLANVNKGNQQQPPKVFKKITVNDARNKLNKNKPQDLRAKVNNLKARNADAREKIRARQNNKNPQQQRPQQQQHVSGQIQQKVVVTGLGRPFKGLVNPTGVTEVGGLLTRTVKTSPQQSMNQRGVKTGMGISKTIRGPGGRGAGPISVRVTPRNEQQKVLPVSAPSALSGQQPKVRIQNEHYVPPPPQRQAPVAVQQPQYRYNYTPEPRLTQPYIEPQPPQHHQQQHQPLQIMEPVLQQVIQPAYQPSYVTSADYDTAFSTPSSFSQTDASSSSYRVIVTNLHPIVTQDDLVELFGSIGALKKARLVKPGIAEVVYTTRDDALMACKKYHMRELDGQPMQVNMTSLAKARLSPPKPIQRAPVRTASPIVYNAPAQHKAKKQSKPRPPPIKMVHEPQVEPVGRTEYQPLSLGKDNNRPGPSNMDMNLVNKALFKTQIPGPPSRPVTFTVKI